ncbi:hypothetical protein HanRHA438_Chr12g0554911 [Helianthus annuus]|nr:hypothetical protein HanRHA438_Chr12g0554911 [Helianthus annuus]
MKWVLGVMWLILQAVPMVPGGAPWCSLVPVVPPLCPVVPIEKLSDQGVSSFVSFGTDNTKLFSPTFDLEDGVLGSDDTKNVYFFDDGVARMVEGRFLNPQPHFAASDVRKI